MADGADEKEVSQVFMEQRLRFLLRRRQRGPRRRGLSSEHPTARRREKTVSEGGGGETEEHEVEGLPENDEQSDYGLLRAAAFGGELTRFSWKEVCGGWKSSVTSAEGPSEFWEGRKKHLCEREAADDGAHRDGHFLLRSQLRRRLLAAVGDEEALALTEGVEEERVRGTHHQDRHAYHEHGTRPR